MRPQDATDPSGLYGVGNSQFLTDLSYFAMAGVPSDKPVEVPFGYWMGVKWTFNNNAAGEAVQQWTTLKFSFTVDGKVVWMCRASIVDIYGLTSTNLVFADGRAALYTTMVKRFLRQAQSVAAHGSLTLDDLACGKVHFKVSDSADLDWSRTRHVSSSQRRAGHAKMHSLRRQSRGYAN